MQTFNKPDKAFIKELALTAKMEEGEVIENLFKESNLRDTKLFLKEELNTVVEKGHFRALVLNPLFFKAKKFEALNQLPKLESFYMWEGLAKAKMNRVKKLEITGCETLKNISISAGKLEELHIDSPLLESLDLNTELLKTLKVPNTDNLRSLKLMLINETCNLEGFAPNLKMLEKVELKNTAYSLSPRQMKDIISLRSLGIHYQNLSTSPLNGMTIDLNKSPHLEEIILWETGVRKVNLKKCSNLNRLELTERRLGKISYSAGSLEHLDVFYHTELFPPKDIDKCKNLKSLRLGQYKGKAFKPRLEFLDNLCLVDPQLEELDLTACPNLKKSYITGGYIKRIKIHCEDIEFRLDPDLSLQELDITGSLDSVFLEYQINSATGITLTCRDIQLKRHHWLEKDFTKFNIIESSAEELDRFLQSYNWDEGQEILQWIADHANCEQGTALRLYWMSGPEWFSQYEKEEDVPSHAREDYRFVKKIERLYLDGHFKEGPLSFDPNADWVGSYPKELVRERIPAIMYKAV